MLIAAGFASSLGWPTTSPPAWARWAALTWAGCVSGVALITVATSSGLRRLDPAWVDAARAAGASRRRAWLDVEWPNLRPGVARASALVFTLALVEPAGPLVLGLDRTLAVQLVRAATRLDQPTRASALALLAAAIALAGRMLIARWGGRDHSRLERPGGERTPDAGLARASLARSLGAAWCASAAVPVVLWLSRGLRSPGSASPGPVVGWFADPGLRSWAANSAVTSALAVALALAILRAMRPIRGARDSRAVGLACRLFEALPPLALGAWALAVPWLLLGLADSVQGPASGAARWLARELGPGRSPGYLLVLVLAAGLLPTLAEVARRARGSDRSSRADAARLMGLSDARADRGGWLGVVPVAPALLGFATAATSLAPALLLAPFSERRTLATAALTLLTEPGAVDPRVYALASAILGLNLVALAAVTSMNHHVPTAPLVPWERGRG